MATACLSWIKVIIKVVCLFLESTLPTSIGNSEEVTDVKFVSVNLIK